MSRTPAPAPPMEDLHRNLREWARGVSHVEAAVELLVRSGLGRRGDVWEACAGWNPDDGTAWLERDLLAAAVRDWKLHLSTGEARVLAVVASLLTDRAPVDLGSVLPDLDAKNLVLVLAAMSHAAGHRTQPYGPLVEWPF